MTGTVIIVVIEDLTGYTVRGLQEMLRTVAYRTNNVPVVITDGIFGPETRESVMEFQRAYGLETTGDIDRKTWDRLRDEYIRLEILYAKPDKADIVSERIYIRPGDQTAELYVIQAMLYALSTILKLPVIEITGVHDQNSVNSVIFIQGISGLEPTGDIDVQTYNKIAGLYSSNIAKNINFD